MREVVDGLEAMEKLTTRHSHGRPRKLTNDAAFLQIFGVKQARTIYNKYKKAKANASLTLAKCFYAYGDTVKGIFVRFLSRLESTDVNSDTSGSTTDTDDDVDVMESADMLPSTPQAHMSLQTPTCVCSHFESAVHIFT